MPARNKDAEARRRVTEQRKEDLREAAQLIRRIGAPIVPRENAKASIGRIAEDLGWAFNRAYDVWYMDAGRIDAWEMDVLRSKDREVARAPKERP